MTVTPAVHNSDSTPIFLCVIAAKFIVIIITARMLIVGLPVSAHTPWPRVNPDRPVAADLVTVIAAIFFVSCLRSDAVVRNDPGDAIIPTRRWIPVGPYIRGKPAVVK